MCATRWQAIYARDAGEAIACASRPHTRTHAGACPQPDGTIESADWHEVFIGNVYAQWRCEEWGSSTALVKRIVGMHVNNLKEAI